MLLQQPLALGADHAGYELKESLKRHLTQAGYRVEDLGTHAASSTDYPDYAQAVAERVAQDEPCEHSVRVPRRADQLALVQLEQRLRLAEAEHALLPEEEREQGRPQAGVTRADDEQKQEPGAARQKGKRKGKRT